MAHGVSEKTAARLVRSLAASEVAGLAFCRLLERWARGEPDSCTPERRQAAFRRAAERAETALTGLDQPLVATCSSSSRRARPFVVRRAGTAASSSGTPY